MRILIMRKRKSEYFAGTHRIHRWTSWAHLILFAFAEVKRRNQTPRICASLVNQLVTTFSFAHSGLDLPSKLLSAPPAPWLCEKGSASPSPSRSTWPSTCVQAPSAPSVKSPPTSLASLPRPLSLSRSRPIRWQLPPRSVQVAGVPAEGPLVAEEVQVEGAAACCRRCYQGRGAGAHCRPWAAWTPPSRLTAVTATTTVSQIVAPPNSFQSAVKVLELKWYLIQARLRPSGLTPFKRNLYDWL